jgi:hypothetical protein
VTIGSAIAEPNTRWRINTRGLPWNAHEPPPIERERNDQWVEVDWEQFAQTPGAVVFYVHGNRTPSYLADRRADEIFNALSAEDSQIRFVIWSWPSDRVKGQIRDVRVKAARTEVESRLMAAFLDRLPPDVDLRFISYSYGARIISGAIDRAALPTTIADGDGDDATVGGELATAGVVRQQTSARAVMLAAAIHSHWLRPGQRHETTVPKLDHLLILYNVCDPALKRYRFVERCARPQALGYRGLYVDDHPVLFARVAQQNVSGWVGKTHAEMSYWRSPDLVDSIREALFPGPAITATSPATPNQVAATPAVESSAPANR